MTWWTRRPPGRGCPHGVLPEELQKLEERAVQTGRKLAEAIRKQDFEEAAMLRDAEGDFRRELEAGKRRWQAEHAPRAVGEEHIPGGSCPNGPGCR